MIASINAVPTLVGMAIPKKTYKLIEWSGLITFYAAGIPIVSPIGKILLENIACVVNKQLAKKGIYSWQFPDLIEKDLFIRSGRHELFGKEIFHICGDRYILNASLEECTVDYLQQVISTYKQLPLYICSTSKRFRDTATKRGINRLKEFWMTDVFGVHQDESSALLSFHDMQKVFQDIFDALGLQLLICKQEAEKRIFFFCESAEGEHYIQMCADTHMFEGKGARVCGVCNQDLDTKKAFGVGVFMLCSSQIIKNSKLKIDAACGKIVPCMASYSLGLERLLYAITEQHRDAFGVVYPPSIRPFDVAILLPKRHDERLRQIALREYNMLTQEGKRCFLDDRRSMCLDEKRFFSDVLGVPNRMIIRYTSKEVVQVFNEKRVGNLQGKLHNEYRGKSL